MKSSFAVGLVTGLAAGAAAGWFAKPPPAGGLPERAPGSHAMLETGLESAPGVSVINSDVVIPAGKSVAKHTHPGEELVYLI
jgi:quercetin dioxygenase-like cupin family protein